MLAIDTRQGRAALKVERRVAEALGRDTRSRPHKLGDVDRVDYEFYRGERLLFLSEIKGRSLDLQTLKRYGSLLISLSKVTAGIGRSLTAACPFCVHVPIRGGRVVYWRVADRGRQLFSFASRLAETQRSVHLQDESKLEMCAFLPLEAARIWTPSICEGYLEGVSGTSSELSGSPRTHSVLNWVEQPDIEPASEGVV